MLLMRFPVSMETAFDYLADPAHRPAWQSSLARVDDVSGEVGVGQAWTDVTRPGLRPRMRTTTYQRPRRWAEEGTWRGIAAELTLTFGPDGPEACQVVADMRFSASGPLRLALPLVRLSAPLAARADLRRAARILGDR